MNKKINLYFNGDYVCSTNQSKTCKEARARYLETLEIKRHSFAGMTLIDERISKRPDLLKAWFDKGD